jgi:hypothetical protein
MTIKTTAVDQEDAQTVPRLIRLRDIDRTVSRSDWPEVGARYSRIFARVGAADAPPVELAEHAGVGYGRS